MNSQQKEEYLRHTILDNKYIPHEPTERQLVAIMRMDRELFYGGAGGGGKSDYLLMTALQFVDYPGYAALILMETVSNLGKPDALLDRAHDWLYGSDAVWQDKKKSYLFPSGARMDFGYMQYENDKYQYKSAAYHTICFDEVTMFTETQYSYLFTRNRKPKNFSIPLRVRSAANPDGPGVIWVKNRFVDKKNDPLTGKPRVNKFIPAKLTDNPHIDQQDYIAGLALTDPLTRRRIQDGEWLLGTGEIFKREWFKKIESWNTGGREVRCWDIAATEKNTENDPDFAVGAKFVLEPDNVRFIYKDRVKLRANPGAVMEAIKTTAELDGKEVIVLVEQDPGAAGKITLHAIKKMLPGYAVWGTPAMQNKVARAGPVASYAYGTDGSDGEVYIAPGPWNDDFLDQADAFPNMKKDDDIDVLSAAFNWLMSNRVSGDIISGSYNTIPDPESIRETMRDGYAT